jgi:CheY-like chemotaxis protein
MADVLVVDDDADTLEMVVKTLEKAGHHVVPARNGWEGLLALDGKHVDLIILDLMMPGMNGPTFLRVVRNDNRRKSLPVIVLTALPDGDLPAAAKAHGVQASFTKADYTATALLDAVERLVHPLPLGDRATEDQASNWTRN